MDFKVAAELAEYPVVIRWPVQWGDQDAFGHVNNTLYFRWFESVRLVYLAKVGLTRYEDAAVDVGPILAHIGCNFRRQIKFPDHVQIAARVTRLGNSSFTMMHALYSEALGAIAADGDSTIVVFDYSRQKSSPIPAEVREAIARLEGNALSGTPGS